jgi:hypothetical protein
MARSPKVAARRADALRMRREGHDYAAITERLGYSSQDVCRRDVSRAMTSAVTDEAKHNLALELSRLDAVQAALWPNAMQGDHQAAREIIRLSEHRCRLLRLGDAAMAVAAEQELEQQRGILANFLDVAGQIVRQE